MKRHTHTSRNLFEKRRVTSWFELLLLLWLLDLSEVSWIAGFRCPHRCPSGAKSLGAMACFSHFFLKLCILNFERAFCVIGSWFFPFKSLMRHSWQAAIAHAFASAGRLQRFLRGKRFSMNQMVFDSSLFLESRTPMEFINDKTILPWNHKPPRNVNRTSNSIFLQKHFHLI